MRPRSARLLAALLTTLVFGVGSAPASGALGDLHVAEEGSWHAERNFEFEWQPLPPPGSPTEAVYRLFDSDGKTVRALTRSLGDLLDPFWVPPVPGIYTLEAWLQDAAGAQGTHSTAMLRFDDTSPSVPELEEPEGWVLGVDDAVVKIAPPTSLPLSGIRGYATSVDRGGGSSPCAGARCSPEELDLAWSEGGSISLGTLPEGINFVRAVAASGAGITSPIVTAEVRVDGTPPLLSLHGAPDGWSDGPVQVAAQAIDPLSGMAPAGPLGPFTAISVDGFPPARSFGDTVTTWVTDSGIHRVDYFARDTAGNVSGTGPGAQPGTATVRIDEDPPAVAFASAQDPADPERLEAFATDALSGPDRDRGWIGVRLAGTAARFEPLPTQVAGNRLIARWNSDSYPNGRYEFLATGFDAAGNAATSTNRISGAKMILTNPLKTRVDLKAGLSHRRFAGRLRSSGGPLAGQEITVSETFAAGAKPQQRTTVVHTSADGRFSLRLPSGPSREVIASFAGSRALTRVASESVRLEVPASVRLHASASSAQVGGAPIVFSGKVAATGVATALKGLPVELQFRYRGGSWSEFRTVETNRRGRFRYAYRFSDDDSRGVRFQFRAYVKGREGWPYGPGTSRPVLVTGR